MQTALPLVNIYRCALWNIDDETAGTSPRFIGGKTIGDFNRQRAETGFSENYAGKPEEATITLHAILVALDWRRVKRVAV